MEGWGDFTILQIYLLDLFLLEHLLFVVDVHGNLLQDNENNDILILMIIF